MPSGRRFGEEYQGQHREQQSALDRALQEMSIVFSENSSDSHCFVQRITWKKTRRQRTKRATVALMSLGCAKMKALDDSASLAER
jgi:hypothetical protein